MLTSTSQDELVQAAELLYHTRFRSELEPAHNGKFIAIEPTSGEYFLGETLSEAFNPLEERIRIDCRTPCAWVHRLRFI